MKTKLHLPRREFLQRTAGGALGLSGGLAFMESLYANPGRMAEELQTTPFMTEGPFYPDKLPLDTDNDLLIINDSITPSVGQICYFGGKVMDRQGNPIRNAKVEIWQVDNNGVYLHSRGGPREKLDTNFQGFGRFITGFGGEYYFRTIKPAAYVGRTPHIHVAVSIHNKRVLTTQCLIRGHAENQKDILFNRIQGEAAKQRVQADFKPVKNSKLNEVSAVFDLVIGVTPNEDRLVPKN